MNNNNEINLNKLKSDKENNNEEIEYEEDEPNKIKLEGKNFSQQVDFLYHPNDPENKSSIKNILIKQYKKQEKLITEEKYPPNNKNKLNIKNNKKKREIPYSNKNKGLFGPYLSKRELDYESKIKKEREERQKKIYEYEKNQNKKKL